jgi:hypothetical protein
MTLLRFLFEHQFFQTPAIASVWIDARTLTHSLRSCISALAFCWCIDFSKLRLSPPFGSMHELFV